jgi:hypothetical protein
MGYQWLHEVLRELQRRLTVRALVVLDQNA